MDNIDKKEIQKRLDEIEGILDLIKNKLGLNQFYGLGIGDTFNLIGIEWKILDIIDQGYVCFGESLGKKVFDKEYNNWKESQLRNYLNDKIYIKICEEIGADNIIEFERDLLSMDGQTEYGKCNDLVSLISIDEYRKYRKLIPNYGEQWWTLTPDSTKCNEDTGVVRCVCSYGCVYYCNCDWSGGAVRPFCIFSYTIFQS